MARSPAEALRRTAWAVSLAVYLGAVVELVLSEHWGEWQQWIAFVAVGVAAAVTAICWRRPSPKWAQVTRIVSLAVLAVSVLGVGFHVWGNAEFSLEVSPGDTLVERVWDTLSGGNPAFAPGMLAVAAVLAWSAARPAEADSTD